MGRGQGGSAHSLKPSAQLRGRCAMKLRRQLFAIALLLTTSVTGLGGLSTEQKRERLRMLRTDGFRKMSLTPLDRAYLDVRTLLSQPGSCSEFFGRGPAQDVLEELVIKLRA